MDGPLSKKKSNAGRFHEKMGRQRKKRASTLGLQEGRKKGTKRFRPLYGERRQAHERRIHQIEKGVPVTLVKGSNETATADCEDRCPDIVNRGNRRVPLRTAGGEGERESRSIFVKKRRTRCEDEEGKGSYGRD